MSPRSPLVARLALLSSAVLFSTGGAIIKSCTLSGWQVASLRSLVAAAALLVFVPATRARWSVRTLLIALPYAATMVLFVSANKLTTAANTIFLQSTAPLYVLLLGPWWLREPLTRRDFAFLVVFAGGLALFLADDGPRFASAPDPLRGNLLAALSGLSWAFTVTGLRFAERGQPAGAAPALVLGNLLAGLLTLPPALPLPVAQPLDWALIAYLGVFQIALAYFCLTVGVRGVTAFETSLLLLLEPALNPVWAWWVHGEVPGTRALFGGGILLATSTIRVWLESHGSPASGEPPTARRER